MANTTDSKSIAAAAQAIPAAAPDGHVENELAAVVLNQGMTRLHELVGLKDIKSTIERLKETQAAKRQVEGHAVLGHHFVFAGNPGTGKTTVARILADLFYGLGYLPTKTLVEVDRSGIIMPYIGQTALNMNALCDKAMGGILFIDDASELKCSDHDSSGQEALDVLVRRMENDRGKLVVIAAGYPLKMRNFMDSNLSLRRLFTNYVVFEDYNAAEMHAIFISLAKQKNLEFEPRFEEALRRTFEYQLSNQKFLNNARVARRLFDRTLEACATRVAGLSLDENTAASELRVLQTVDLGPEETDAATDLVTTWRIPQE